MRYPAPFVKYDFLNIRPTPESFFGDARLRDPEMRRKHHRSGVRTDRVRAPKGRAAPGGVGSPADLPEVDRRSSRCAPAQGRPHSGGAGLN
jgi:hypothetical protein